MDCTSRRCSLAFLAAGLLLATFIVSSAIAQEPYRRPPQEIVDILEAPPLPMVSLNPQKTMMVLSHRVTLPPIGDMAEPMLRLAGSRINLKTNGRHGPRRMDGLTLKSVATGAETPIELPADPDVGYPSWSPSGERFAFTITKPDGIELWAVEVSTGKAKQLSGAILNGAAGGYRWMPDGRTLLCRFVPDGRGDPPQRPLAPTGPVTQESSSRTSPVRTYQDLLTDAHDEAMFEYVMTAQLALVDATTGERTDIGAPAIFTGADPDPTGQYLLVSRTVRPYSYLVTAWSFPEVVEVWDRIGVVVAHIADLPLRDTTPIEGVPTGPRGHFWRPHENTSQLFWTEALDEGDPKNEVPHRDKIMTLVAPFDGEPREVHRTEHRSRGISWIDNTSLALIGEYDRDRRWSRTWLFDVDEPSVEAKLVWDLSSRDRYNDPGRPVTKINKAGRFVARHDGDWIYLSGRGATPDGDRPFFDRMNLETLETERQWQCEGECLESFVDVLPGGKIMTRWETPDEPPNYYVRDLEDGTRSAITHFEHPAPQLRDVYKELVTYERADGVQLSATLYLPAGYDQQRDGPLPLLVWAYPMEYNDARTAGQVSGSPYRFTSIGGTSHLFLLTQGYAIMDGATMPVIGDPETMNDTFIEQIVSSAQAAIDYAAQRGVGDPNRVGVGGHSYGAFMTANLLAHCDLFNAGVARSGAYNRTLTPFGFQSERRTFWEAPMSYFQLSPFMHADKINEPLLMIHGQMDNNSGTFPIQSERMYHAIKGHGGTVRLVMLPYESHGYRAKESVMHVLAEMIDWFDEHVKNAPTAVGAR